MDIPIIEKPLTKEDLMLNGVWEKNQLVNIYDTKDLIERSNAQAKSSGQTPTTDFLDSTNKHMVMILYASAGKHNISNQKHGLVEERLKRCCLASSGDVQQFDVPSSPSERKLLVQKIHMERT